MREKTRAAGIRAGMASCGGVAGLMCSLRKRVSGHAVLLVGVLVLYPCPCGADPNGVRWGGRVRASARRRRTGSMGGDYFLSGTLRSCSSTPTRPRSCTHTTYQPRRKRVCLFTRTHSTHRFSSKGVLSFLVVGGSGVLLLPVFTHTEETDRTHREGRRHTHASR